MVTVPIKTDLFLDNGRIEVIMVLPLRRLGLFCKGQGADRSPHVLHRAVQPIVDGELYTVGCSG